jgi:competence protein ComEC
MLYSALAFLAGICVYQYLPGFPSGECRWLLAGLPLVFFPVPLMRTVGLFCAGLLWICWQASLVSSAQLPAHLEGEDILVRGVVQGLPESLGGQRLRFGFLIDQISEQDHWQAQSLLARITWYRNELTLEPGERWQFKVRLKRPRGFSNPGGFDYQRWLVAQGIQVTGYVRKGKANQRLYQTGGQPVQGLRQQLSLHIQQLEMPVTMRALLRALGIGDRSAMSTAQWQVLQKTGTSHLLAISGLHVGMVAGMVFFITRQGWSLLGDPQRWPAPRVAAPCSMIAALAYALLAGFQVPAQRALVMVSLWMLAVMWTGRPDPWRVWGLALLAVLLMDPFSVADPGFWLSFAAVALICQLTLGRHGQTGRLRHLLNVQFGLLLGLAPLQWLWFQQLSISAPFANLIAIPWVGLLVVPLMLAGILLLPFATGAGDWLLGLSAHSLSILWWVLEQLAGLPVNLWQSPAVSGGWMLLFALGIVIVLLPGAIRLAPVGVMLLLPVFWLQPERPARGDVWFTLLDVGQGLAAVVETRSRVLVYDSGPAFRSGFNTGDAVLVPYLVSQGYRHIDRLVISHADNDHIGGAPSLFNRLDVFSIYSGEPGEIDWAQSKQCMAGQRWTWDQVQFEYLAPFVPGEGNNSSCVLRIETTDARVLLLTGDIERSVEQQLVEQQAQRLAADILVAPHHGSRTSSTDRFVNAVHPEYVLFPVGYRNRFGFPKPDVVERYRETGARILDTATSGAVRIRLDAGRGIEADGYRQRRLDGHRP